MRVRLDTEEGRWTARRAGPQGSGILSTMTRANGYAILPADAEALEEGAAVLCQLFEGM
jgi:molybdopterin biosynthesis enzyme